MTHRLYDLLPMILRERDAARGSPLRALMDVLGVGYDHLAGDIDRLYDDWFIETCDPAIIPYIAALLDMRGIPDAASGPPDARRSVANGIAYRRRKGLAAALANAMADATGWTVIAVDDIDRLSATQDLAQLRLTAGRTLDLRLLEGAAPTFGPFSNAAHGCSLRSGPPRATAATPEPLAGDGAFAPNAVNVFLWRLTSFPVGRQELREAGPGRFFFHPLGVDAPLFAPPRRQPPPGDQVAADALPMALDHDRLRAGLQRGPEAPLRLWADWGDGPRPLSPRDIGVSGLDHWKAQPGLHGKAVLVDPGTGRALFHGDLPRRVWADFAYGAVAALGGGPTSRPSARKAMAATSGIFRVGPGAQDLAQALLAAVAAGGDATILIEGSDLHYLPDAARLQVPGGCHLAIRAADGATPTLIGALDLHATGQGAKVSLDGLRLDGPLVLCGPLQVTASDCTLGPPGAASGRGGVHLSGPPALPSLTLRSVIAGPITVAAGDADLLIEDSIIDGRGAVAIGWPPTATPDLVSGPVARLARSTILGAIQLKEVVEASDCLILGELQLLNSFRGYIRFSYVPLSPLTPTVRFRCLPAGETGAPTDAPRLTSLRYGDPGYGQLALDCPAAVRTGAANGSEMGAFCRLNTNHRAAALIQVLEEFLPLGIRARLFCLD
jgi:hypothetical protein